VPILSIDTSIFQIGPYASPNQSSSFFTELMNRNEMDLFTVLFYSINFSELTSMQFMLSFNVFISC
jgi:hypothetical protein